MKKISLLLLCLLLLNCAACQTIEEPLQTSAPSETAAAAAIPPMATDAEATETRIPTVTPISVQPSLTPTLALPDPTPAPAIGTVLLIFGDRFIGEIYTTVRPAFEDAGYRVVVASRSLTPLKAKSTELSVEVDLLLEDVQVSDYDAVLFLCDNDLTFGSALPETNRIAQEAVAQGLWVGAICSGPRILAYAQVVEGLTVTGEPSQTCQLLEQAGALCTSNGVERDGNIITARDRFSSQLFVETFLDAMAETPTVPVPAGTIAFYSDRDGNPEIYTIHADGSGLVRLTNDPAFDDSPAISPDGTQLVFLTARHDPNPQFPNLKYEIYLMDIDGSNLLRLTQTAAAEDHPAWSPDGSKIIFDADYDGDGFFEIYTIHPDGSGLARLTFGAANDQFADWSPDGSQIAFASDRNGNWDLFVMSADGSNQQPLTTSPDWELFPAWSPDGTQIAFNVVGSRPGNTDVFLMNADGSDPRQLTDTPGYDENPAWSPDGAQIAFQTQRDGHFEVYIMNADGSQQRPLAAHPSDELWPSWGLAAPPQSDPAALLQLTLSSQELDLEQTFQTALGDLDGDGDLDAVFANPMRNAAQAWLNDGRGYFVDSGQELTQYGHGVGLADFDGDGDLDAVIVCHQFSLPSQIYLNDGSGLFTATGQDFGDARFSAADVNLLDLNSDGFMDVHILYYSENGVPDRVYLNDGKAVFRDSGLALDEDFIAWGDLDSDGDVDYFGKHWGQGYVVMLQDGNGQFSLGWQMEDLQATVGDVVLADFDADGDLDALIANGFRDTGSQPGRLLWNNGLGQFTDSGQALFETMGAHLAVGDLDLDGDLDVFVTNMDRANEVWLYQAGGFHNSGLALGNSSEMSGRPTLGDLDGDGDLDVIVGRFRGGAEIWFNNLAHSCKADVHFQSSLRAPSTLDHKR